MRKYYLALLVWNNYRMRKQGILPDEWFWADKELLDMGYYIDPRYPWPRKLSRVWYA